jgi:hypothetical protein
LLRKIILFSIVVVFFLLFLTKGTYPQIRVFERQSIIDTVNKGLYWKSDKRIQIDLNGKWDVSFDNGKYFGTLLVPLAYIYDGYVDFKRKIVINDSIIQSFSFLLVAEGINYDAEVKINNVFITHHTGGFNSIIVPIDENIIKSENEIYIRINSELDNSSTIPLANRINFSENYGGINKDIYLLALPKIYVFDNRITYKIDPDNTIKITNIIDINSENLSALKTESKDFFVKTSIVKKANGETVSESNGTKINISDYQTQNITNDITLKNPALWSPDSPDLYLVKTIIYNSSRIIDDKITETGFHSIKIRPDNILLNGKPVNLNGINYYEDNQKTGSALDFVETEKDLLKIKEYGFNCIRVPGRSAHPYILNICNRIGLFLMQEIPFNEVPGKNLSSRKYIQDALDYAENIVKRDMNSPCILAWGAGNNFDVTGKAGVNYVKSVKENISKLDYRPVYYTTRNIEKDKCSEFADIIGINFITKSPDKIQEDVNRIKDIYQKNKNIFASSYGYCITNDNRNGFGDIYSVEAQAKLLSDGHRIFSNTFFGNFISSYADWNSGLPLNFHQSLNPFLKTDGLFDINKEPKFSAAIIKRINFNQSFQKIPEGSGEKLYNDSSSFFIITGIAIIIIFIFLLSRIRYFKENLWKSLKAPNNFAMFVKEQMLISSERNLILSLIISTGIGLYYSSLIYLLRDNNSFDMILSNTFTGVNSKLLFSSLSNSPEKLFITISIIVFIKLHILSFIIFLLNRFAIRKVYFRTIYTITIWSFIPTLLLLFIGTIFYKYTSSSPNFFFISLIVFAVTIIYSIYTLISNVRIVFEMPAFKTYLYSFVFIIIIFTGLYFYFNFVKSSISIISLILSY